MNTDIRILNGVVVSDDQLIDIQSFSSVLNSKFVNQQGIIRQGNWLFWDEVYFNLMASMRKMRIEIPMLFSIDYFKDIASPALHNDKNYTYTISVYVEVAKVHYLIHLQEVKNSFENSTFEIEVFKDLKILPNYLNAINNAQPINVVAKQYALDNDWNDVLLLNTDLKVARAITGNIYFIKEDVIFTNSIDDGAYRQAIDLLFKKQNDIKTEAFSAFELQKADEVFILTESKGIIPVKKFRKKEFTTNKALELQKELIK